MATPTASLGEEVSRRKKQSRTKQHIKDKILYTDPYIALYHVMREHGTLVAPQLWAEEGVGRTKLNNDEMATALRLS